MTAGQLTRYLPDQSILYPPCSSSNFEDCFPRTDELRLPWLSVLFRVVPTPYFSFVFLPPYTLSHRCRYDGVPFCRSFAFSTKPARARITDRARPAEINDFRGSFGTRGYRQGRTDPPVGRIRKGSPSLSHHRNDVPEEIYLEGQSVSLGPPTRFPSHSYFRASYFFSFFFFLAIVIVRHDVTSRRSRANTPENISVSCRPTDPPPPARHFLSPILKVHTYFYSEIDCTAIRIFILFFANYFLASYRC